MCLYIHGQLWLVHSSMTLACCYDHSCWRVAMAVFPKFKGKYSQSPHQTVFCYCLHQCTVYDFIYFSYVIMFSLYENNNSQSGVSVVISKQLNCVLMFRISLSQDVFHSVMVYFNYDLITPQTSTFIIDFGIFCTDRWQSLCPDELTVFSVHCSVFSVQCSVLHRPKFDNQVRTILQSSNTRYPQWCV